MNDFLLKNRFCIKITRFILWVCVCIASYELFYNIGYLGGEKEWGLLGIFLFVSYTVHSWQFYDFKSEVLDLIKRVREYENKN